MKRLFEAAVNANVFRGKALLMRLLPELDEKPELRAVVEKLEAAWPSLSVGQKVFLGIVRWSFLIELVKAPKIETTKFEVRWADRLGEGDPRFSSFEDCMKMCIFLTTEAANATNDEKRKALLDAFIKHSLVPYELPIDYCLREQSERLHVPGNVEWLWGGEPRKAVLLRKVLASDTVGDHAETFAAAYNKIKVKTYLTDRVLTGVHKTNREKRWETHPASVHFALRRDCLDIEHTLIEQLCCFEGFPAAIRDELGSLGLVNASTKVYRCPVTFEPLSFNQFEEEIRNPVAGKALFQVGHMNPLKAVNDDEYSGHTAKNVCWISADGNRIQGPLSLEDTQALIMRISANYLR